MTTEHTTEKETIMSTPNTDDVRNAYIAGTAHLGGHDVDEFDRWLAATRAEVAQEISLAIRRHCTITDPVGAMKSPYPVDAVVSAVADWVENPPEWVNPSWRAPVPDDREEDR